MFEDVDALAAPLLASAPAQDDPFDPVLDPDGSLVDRLVALARVISAAQAETMTIEAALCERADTWQTLHATDWLPLTLAAMRRGDLDLGRVLAIVDATMALSDTDAGKVETAVLGKAVDQTAGELRAALRKAVIRIDPPHPPERTTDADPLEDRPV
jgi:hypothetical protein